MILCLVIYFIYYFSATQKLIYLSLGDSLALGENAYGEVQYGYSDYVASYLERNDLLSFYTKDFAKSGARVEDVKDMILKNETIKIEKEQYVLKELLRRADLITLSIGANNVLSPFSSLQDYSFVDEEKVVQKIEDTVSSLDQLLTLIQKYTRGEIILLGYYNPFPEDAKLQRLFSYYENAYQTLAKKHKISYISLSALFKTHEDYLPNPFNIHPGSKGYSAISNQIIAHLEKSLLHAKNVS